MANSTLSVTYGTATVGGGSATVGDIDGPVIIAHSPEAIAISFRAAVTGATVGDAQALGDTLVNAFRQVRVDLSVDAGVTNILTLEYSNNTGLDPQPDITLVEDHGRTKIYDVRVRVGLPADYSGLDGRRTTTITLDYAATRRRQVTVKGTWTAIGGDNAITKYEADIDAYCATVLSGLGITASDLIDEDGDYHETNQTYDFMRVYAERLISKFHANINYQTLKMSMEAVGPGDSETLEGETTVRLVEWSVDYTAEISTTSLGTDALKILWSGTILPEIIRQVETEAGYSIACVSAKANLGSTENQIVATCRFRGAPSPGPVEWSLSQRIDINDGYEITPIWTGNPLDAYVFNGVASVTMTLTDSGVWASEDPPESASAKFVRSIAERRRKVVAVRGRPVGVTWVPQPWFEDIREIDLGLATAGSKLRLWSVQRKYTFRGITESAVFTTARSRGLFGKKD